MRRALLFFRLTLVLVFFGAAFWPPFVEAAERKAVFAHDWVPYGKHINFYAGVEKGFYKAVGLDVEVLRGYGGADTAKRLADKRIDFGFADTPSVITIRSRGGMVKLIGIMADKGMAVLYTLGGSGIREPKDLSGRTIGDSAGGACITIFPALAKLQGIQNWKHLVMDPTAKNPSLLAAKVDAICTFSAIEPVLIEAGKKQGLTIQAITFSDWGLDMSGAGMIARDETVRGEPDLVRRFTEGTYKAMAWTVENPDEAVSIFLRLNPVKNREITRAEWEVAARHLMTDTAKQQGIGYMDPKKMARTVELVIQYTNLPATVKAEDLYINEFLPKLFPKYQPMG